MSASGSPSSIPSSSRIGETGGAKFWFHGLRNCFITVAERELMLPPSLTKRLVIIARVKAGEDPLPASRSARPANGPTVAELAAVRCKPKTAETGPTRR